MLRFDKESNYKYNLNSFSTWTRFDTVKIHERKKMKTQRYPSFFLSIVACLTIIFASAFALTPAAAQSEEENKIAQAGQAEKKEEARPIRAFLNINKFYYYEGDPVEVEIMLGNKSKETMKNPIEAPFSKWYLLKDEKGNEIKAAASPDDAGEQHASILKPSFFYGIMLDLTKNFPVLKKAGHYTLSWGSGDIRSNEVLISVIKKYDPEKDYYAIVETEFGNFRLDFFKNDAPLAVKAFIDFANAGFYNGMIFYQAKPADFVAAGDPKGDGSGTSGFPFPAEYNTIPIVTGTVMMSQHLSAPPRNDGKFLITLKSHPEKTGFMTVFAQVTDNLDIVKKMSTVPTTELVQEPFFKPLKDVEIKKITVFEKEQKK